MTKYIKDFSNINKNITQQKLSIAFFKQLKNIKDAAIAFIPHKLTAIMGPNGCGKSTILHALACVYQPLDDTSVNYKFSQFFTPTTHSKWSGSEFSIFHSYRQGKEEHIDIVTSYSKDKRWLPRYNRRPARYVSFIGIITCVPDIEIETQESLIKYSTYNVSDGISNKIREKASFIMNRDYTTYNRHESTRKTYRGVEYKNYQYSSLSMGAGEQRIFFILEEVFKAPQYALILIDEIDLLLHEQALERLINVMLERAKEKKLQIIFTTHAVSVANMSDKINVCHLYQTEEKTIFHFNTKPDAIYRLTGKQAKIIEIFVEDDLAKYLVRKVCKELGIVKYVDIQQYGAARNCFTLIAGLLLKKDENIDNMLFVLDGDSYITEEEKSEQIKKVLTGNTETAKNLRNQALSLITQFQIDSNCQPEKFLHGIILNIAKEMSVTDEDQEIIDIAKNIVSTNDSHKYIDDIIETIGDDRQVGLQSIINLISKSSEWNMIVQNIKVWLESKKSLIQENR